MGNTQVPTNLPILHTKIANNKIVPINKYDNETLSASKLISNIIFSHKTIEPNCQEYASQVKIKPKLQTTPLVLSESMNKTSQESVKPSAVKYFFQKQDYIF